MFERKFEIIQIYKETRASELSLSSFRIAITNTFIIAWEAKET